MNLSIFGASSATGKLLVERALASGHAVTAFVRDPSRLEITHEGLRIISGNALHPAQVMEAVAGNDAVLSTLGPRGKPAVMAAGSTRNIVAAMEAHGVKRLVVISVAGIAVEQDQRGSNFIDGLIKFFLKGAYTDRENQLKVLQTSRVDWVALRVPRLTDDAPTGSVKAFFGTPSPTMKIARADLADFMLKQVTETQWLKLAPIVRN